MKLEIEGRTLEHLHVIEQELRGITIHTPDGDKPGYQMRFQVQLLGPLRTVWTEWFFLSEKALEDWVRTTDHYMRTEGHLSPAQSGPSGPLQ